MIHDHVILPSSWYRVSPVICGYESCRPEHAYGPAVRSYYLLHYVLEGSGTFIRHDGSYTVKQGDIFVIRPSEVTTYRASAADPWHYVWLGFACDEEIPFLHDAVLHQMPVRHLFTWIRDHVENDGIDGKLYCMTHEILWLLSRNSGKEPRSGNRYAEYLKAYMDNAYMNRISIEEVAQRLHIDRRYLTALFRQQYGRSPKAYLMDHRLTMAERFLESGCSVTEAAAMSGFSDLSNFSRKYKSRYGINPSGHDRGSRSEKDVSES